MKYDIELIKQISRRLNVGERSYLGKYTMIALVFS